MSVYPSLVPAKINGVFALDEVFNGTLDPFSYAGGLGWRITDPIHPFCHFDGGHNPIEVEVSNVGEAFGIPAFDVSDDYSDGTSVRPSGERGDAYGYLASDRYLFPELNRYINWTGIEGDDDNENVVFSGKIIEGYCFVLGGQVAEIYPKYWDNPGSRFGTDYVG